MVKINFRHLAVLVVLVLAAFACNIPGEVVDQGQPLLASLKPTLTPVIQFLGAKLPARDPQKIIVLSVIPDPQFNVSEIVLDLPQALADARVFINDLEIEGLQEGDMTRYKLDGPMLAKKVTLHFKTGETILATCVIDTAALLDPAGDCSW